MRRRITAMFITIACGTTFAADLLACGEKFLMPTRATRFAKPPAPGHDATILIYANPASDLSRTLTKLSAAKALQAAGYRPTLSTDPTHFVTALNAGPWDLVVVDSPTWASPAARARIVALRRLSQCRTPCGEINFRKRVVSTLPFSRSRRALAPFWT